MRGRGVDARACGRIARSEGVEGSRVGYTGEVYRRGGLHVVLVPSHCGYSSAECLKGGQLQPGHQGPVLYDARVS